MDGVSIISLFFLFFSFKVSAVEQASPHCAWSSANPAAQSKQLKIQIEKFQTLNQKAMSCPLSENFDHSERNLTLGALQAVAISKQNCDVGATAEVESENFLYQSLRLQGFKLSKKSKKLPTPTEVTPTHLFNQSRENSCFDLVSEDASQKESALKSGDIFVSKAELFVIDQVRPDPFNIYSRLESDVKGLDRVRQEEETPEQLCRSWLTDPSDFHISVLSHAGRTPLFPKFGITSSLWVTAFTERAVQACITEVHASLPASPNRRLASNEVKAGVVIGIKGLRYRTTDHACMIGSTELPGFKDLDCVQFCDFSKQGHP